MPSYKTPTPSQIDTAVQRMRSPEFAAYFFSRLENPLWIAPLRDQAIFASPPPAVVVEGGGMRYPHWPASKFLASMASKAPQQVAAILAALSTDNLSIVGDMLDAANRMQPDDAIALVPAICRVAEEGKLWIHFKDASELCLRLIEGQQLDAASQLADALFTPRFGGGEEGPGRRDEHWYKEGLQKVAPALSRAKGATFLTVLCDWLRAAVTAKKHVDTDTGADYSYSWRPAIEEHEQNHDFDFAGVLVGITRAAFEEAIAADAISLADALAMLQKQVFHVFVRMRIHLINEFTDREPTLARQMMIEHELFDDFRCKHEYAMLVGRRWNMLESEEKAIWLGWIDRGPDMSGFDESIKQNLEREATDEDRNGRICWWQYERLHWIRNHLSDDRLAFYKQMRSEHGDPELADLNVRVGSGWEGEKSPMSVDDLSAMTFTDAVAAVAAWQPENSRFRGPSVEGLASTFKEYLATDRIAFSTHAPELCGQPASYVRSFISEMTQGVKAGQAIDLPSVLKLCQWVVKQPVNERTVPEQDDEVLVDKDWQWTRDEISNFAEEVFKTRTDTGPRYSFNRIRKPIWSLVDTLCRDYAKSYVVHDISNDDPRIYDYLHLGINSPRGKAVRAALEYARWVGNHLKEKENGEEIVPGGFDTMPEVRDMLAWQIKKGNRTYEAMSIIGSRIGVIYWIDRDWLEANADALFDLQGIERSPLAAEGWAAWNAFLVWVRPHVEFYRRFKQQFAYAVGQTATIQSTDRSREQSMNRLGEHLMILYGRGQLDFENDGKLLHRFIETATPEIRRHAIEFVGRSLKGDEQLPEDVLQRFMSLWNIYWAGPGPQDAQDQPDAWLFGTWFGCGKFPRQWSIDQLHHFVKITSIAEPDHSVVERLAAIADTDILTSTKVLDLMVRGDREGWRISGWLESAKTILRKAMSKPGEPRLVAEALINHLGRRGYNEFGDLLRPD